MSDKLEHFVVGQPRHAEKLNKVVDVVNDLTETVALLVRENQELRDALDGKADKRKTRSSSE